MKMHAVQYTVRGVPAEVDLALRDRARIQNISINQVILEELTKAVIGRRQMTDFSDLVGRWHADKAFDEINTQSQRTIVPDDWN